MWLTSEIDRHAECRFCFFWCLSRFTQQQFTLWWIVFFELPGNLHCHRGLHLCHFDCGSRKHFSEAVGVQSFVSARRGTGPTVFCSDHNSDHGLRLRDLGNASWGHDMGHIPNIFYHFIHDIHVCNQHTNILHHFVISVVVIILHPVHLCQSNLARNQVSSVSKNEWGDVGAALSTLLRLAFGVMDMAPIQEVAEETCLKWLATLATRIRFLSPNPSNPCTYLSKFKYGLSRKDGYLNHVHIVNCETTL